MATGILIDYIEYMDHFRNDILIPSVLIHKHSTISSFI